MATRTIPCTVMIDLLLVMQCRIEKKSAAQPSYNQKIEAQSGQNNQANEVSSEQDTTPVTEEEIAGWKTRKARVTSKISHDLRIRMPSMDWLELAEKVII